MAVSWQYHRQNVGIVIFVNGKKLLNEPSDSKGDCVVSGDDLAVWKQRFEPTSAPGGSAVSEPSSFAACLTVAISLYLTSRRFAG